MKDKGGDKATKTKALRSRAEEGNHHVGQLFQLMAGSDAVEIQPKHANLLHLFSGDISRDKAGKVTAIATTAFERS